MIACVDVHYTDKLATTAIVLFDDWSSATPALTFVHKTTVPAAYEPGNFYKRELPCILDALKASGFSPDTIVIDGYVWLSDQGGNQRHGLGAHLFEALGQRVAIIGVAKTQYKSSAAAEVFRGGSKTALYVTAAGLDLISSANRIRSMHGPYRLPTLIKLTDQLARTK